MSLGTGLTLGSLSSRDARASQLLFGWRAGDGSLDAYTGQPGELRAIDAGVGTIAHTITGRNGVTLTVSLAQPRWEQDPTKDTVTRLTLDGSTTNIAHPLVVYPFPAQVQPLAILIRCYPLYTVAASVAAGGGSGEAVLMIGGLPYAGGGDLLIGRLSTNWILQRRVAATTTTVTATVAEVSGQVHPTDVLATLEATGRMQISTRDALGVIRSGTAQTPGTGVVNGATTWGQAQLIFGSLASVALGGRYQYETVKVAPGSVVAATPTLTYAAMDVLW